VGTTRQFVLTAALNKTYKKHTLDEATLKRKVRKKIHEHESCTKICYNATTIHPNLVVMEWYW